MKNITQTLNIIYETIELLIQLEKNDLTDFQYQNINQTIVNLEETRRLLFHEKNEMKQMIN